MDQVPAIFWPFAEEIDGVSKAGNLLHYVRCTLHENWAAESLKVHSFPPNLPCAPTAPPSDHCRMCCQGDDGLKRNVKDVLAQSTSPRLADHAAIEIRRDKLGEAIRLAGPAGKINPGSSDQFIAIPSPRIVTP
ncbi:hypothetical protein OHD62_33460 [Mesorhizobium sp. YC-39]|uniref:hypothetical protein n=1 Tax=unclassified Mesorhizobium TaxID=325217 RepID=UPI0021E738E4|nr:MULTISPECIES: hypothetical protein [unclassified Mesorhizobium]MCV3211529.1 hypothetical protein [Mesorhizobium sp. YC-2]MCV3233273.1 hypothetical protein [Mesorhizobium sp. YC-39]